MATSARAGLARGAPMSAIAVDRLRSTAFVGGVPGLELRFSRGGARAWRLYYRLPGDRRRRVLGLGRYPQISLAEARRRAAAALLQATDGADPKSARIVRAQRSVLTVNAALDKYLEHAVRENDRKTAADKASAFRHHVRPFLGARSLASVRRPDWLGVIDGLGDRPGMRRNLYVYLRHFLGWAVEREMIDTHPLAGVRPPRPVAARDRILTDDEIRFLWAVESDGGDLARLALLTAQRRGTLAAMRWDQVDEARRVWTVPADTMKSGKLHEVPLCDTALAILSERPHLGGPHVFGIGTNGTRPYDGFSNGFPLLRGPAEPGLEPWRFHDLRRTSVTLAQRAGCPLDAIRALTQHKAPGVIGVYARHAYAEEKRDVVERIEKQILSLSASMRIAA